MKTVIFTGGHHTSALQVALSLKSQGWSIIWFGHKYSMWGDKNVSGEFSDIKAAGIPFIDLKAGKFYRTFNPIKLIRIPWGFFQVCFELLKLKQRNDIRGIYSSGGYLAVPTVIVAKLLGIPSITHEQTVVDGYANKLLVLFVNKVAYSWPKPTNDPKFIFTGLPLRKELLEGKSIGGSKVLYITGGKQGSHKINQTIFSLISELTAQYQVIHQTGSSTVFKDYDQAALVKNPNYTYFTYDSKQAVASLLKADLVICRAGAHTIYELAALKKKAVVVPITWVSHNEQYKNAQILANNNQAIIIPEEKLTKDTLLRALTEVKKLKPGNLQVPLDATEQLVDLVKHTFT